MSTAIQTFKPGDHVDAYAEHLGYRYELARNAIVRRVLGDGRVEIAASSTVISAYGTPSKGPDRIFPVKAELLSPAAPLPPSNRKTLIEQSAQEDPERWDGLS